jgi:3-methyladenine DNA glycosylase AlkD
MNSTTDIPQIKQMLYAMRNGIIADTLRKQGAPYRMIYGLNLPQLTEIASQISHDASTAQALWNENAVRECMMLAPMVYPPEQYTQAVAMSWITTAPSTEVIDILCHKLLRHCSFAIDLAQELFASESDMARYAALRLMFNILPAHIEVAAQYATDELSRTCPLTTHIAYRLLDEIDFLLGDSDTAEDA